MALTSVMFIRHQTSYITHRPSNIINISHPLTQTRERIMSNTMSVDEYFDELINQVREDYANEAPIVSVPLASDKKVLRSAQMQK